MTVSFPVKSSFCYYWKVLAVKNFNSDYLTFRSVTFISQILTKLNEQNTYKIVCISGIVFCLEGHCYGQKLYQWQNFSWKEVSSIYCDYPLDMPWLIKSKFHSLSCHLLLCLFVCWIIQMEDGYIFKSPKLKSWDYNWRELMLTLSVTGTIV